MQKLKNLEATSEELGIGRFFYSDYKTFLLKHKFWY
jgi:hypothetical protein